MDSDLISRKALQKELYENINYGHYGEFMDGSKVGYTSRELDRLIESQPTVDAVEVVHGKWIYKGTTNVKMIFECSNCKSLIAGRGRFCKECGAKMDGGDE